MDSQGSEGLRRRLQQQLRETGIQYEVDQDGDFVVRSGDAITFVRPLDSAGRTIVRIWAITNVDLELGDELSRYLVTENAKLGFGGFEADESGKVAFSHSLLGEFLQRAELELALAAVATTADRYNEEIKSRFGGKLFGEP